MAVTADGCPVEAYARLPAEPELSVVLDYAAGRRKVLDLGAGAGRIADPLAAAGHDVLAVDESPAMLDRVRYARTVRSAVEELDLEERFDAVLLLSHLVNTADDDRRTALLSRAAHHLQDDGLLIVQRHDPARSWQPGGAQLGEVRVELTDLDTGRWPLVSAVTRYRVGAQSWAQPWVARILDDNETSDAMNAAGLTHVTVAGAWVTAVRTAS
jgi:SAM-dependent methyltransferase